MGQIIGETGVGETGVGEMGVNHSEILPWCNDSKSCRWDSKIIIWKAQRVPQ